MTVETIVAVYDTAAHAELAANDLKAANVPADAISVHGAAGVGTAAAPREQGFWGSLFGGQPDHDTSVYERSVQSGSTVVTVKAPEEHVASVSRILEAHGPIDIDDRATSYGATATTTATTGETVGMAAPAVRPAATGSTGEEAIALSEEQLVVGKRLVDRGTTRVRRFVVETPVEQDVTLRSEQVSVQRRPVTAGVDAAAFTDRVIEVNQTGEEAVVGKTARVAEEVVVSKQASDHVETIHDTVRREDVEIIKDTATTTGVGTTGTPMTPGARPKI